MHFRPPAPPMPGHSNFDGVSLVSQMVGGDCFGARQDHQAMRARRCRPLAATQRSSSLRMRTISTGSSCLWPVLGEVVNGMSTPLASPRFSETASMKWAKTKASQAEQCRSCLRGHFMGYDWPQAVPGQPAQELTGRRGLPRESYRYYYARTSLINIRSYTAEAGFSCQKLPKAAKSLLLFGQRVSATESDEGPRIFLRKALQRGLQH